MVDVQQIIRYEDGELSAAQTISMFADLVSTGVVWRLQHAYSEAATGLIDSGYISRDGKVTPAGHDWAALVDAAQLEDDEAWLAMESPRE